MYTVYRTTCLVDGRYYIGVHKTERPDDDYLGSGKYLNHAIRKYGRNQFQKLVIAVFEDAQQAYQLEASLVDEKAVSDPACFNLKVGGAGGFDYINASSTASAWKSKAGKIGGKICGSKHYSEGTGIYSEEAKEKQRLATRKMVTEGRMPKFSTKGMKFECPEGHQEGRKNSQFGSRWVHQGTVNRKIKSGDPIPDGWVLGRKLK